jgi:hypothetical protein
MHKRYAQLQMNILDIFRRGQKTQTPTVRGAGATLYPDKIVIETVDRIKDLYGIISANVTILDLTADSTSLGQTLRHHLGLSRDNLKKPTDKDIDKLYVDYLKKVGFKNRKEHHKNALHLTIYQKAGKIFLGPTINGGPTGKNKGFVNTKDQPLTVDTNTTDSELGESIRLGWSKCVCNCA